MAFTIVARGLWDRSTRVRQRALDGLSELGVAAALLLPDLLRQSSRDARWSAARDETIERLSRDPAIIAEVAARVDPDIRAHTRWLKRRAHPAARVAIPTFTRALEVTRGKLSCDFGYVEDWRRREWRDVLSRLKQL